MRPFLRCLLLLLPALVRGEEPVPFNEGVADQEVEQALRALNAAFAKHDLATLKRLMTDDQVSITPSGGMLDRDAHLSQLPDWKITDYKETNLKVTPLTQ